MMRLSRSLIPLLFLASLGCNSTPRRLPIVHAGKNSQGMLALVSGLEGRWQQEASDGTIKQYEFEVTSAGHAVRETMMVGTPEEMTNMYTLDGKDLVLTHYCAGGNQPSMRAAEYEQNRLAFEFESVRDLNERGEIYMGKMTLVIIDENHIEEHWSALLYDAVDHDNVIRLTRIP